MTPVNSQKGSNMNRITKSRKSLEEAYRIIEVNGKFYQDKPRVGLQELKVFIIAKTHKYGKTMIYEYVAPYNYETHRTTLMSYHSFLYAWVKGEVPAGMDVDHIDGDPLNNDISNLQLLTRQENLAKRTGKKNQFK